VLLRRLPYLLLASLACASSPQPAPAPEPAAAGSSEAKGLAPPPWLVAESKTRDPKDPRSTRSDLRRQIFIAAWETVRDKHYDPNLGGVNWQAARLKYEPMAVGAPDEPTFYRVMNEMLGQLGQSHLEVTGPGAEDLPIAEESGPVTGGEPGDPGLTVRIIEGRPTVTHVRANSSAARAGLRPGYLVTHLAGRDAAALPPSARPQRPIEDRFRLRLQAMRRLSGPAGTRVTVRFLDLEDRPGEVMLERDPPRGKMQQIGLLPPLYPEVHVSQVSDVGVIAFNFFLLKDVLPEVQKAIEGFRARGARALILDLRGNPGGVGAMAIPVAARLVTKPLVLGTIQFRDHALTLTAAPQLGAKPFTGRVVVLTDEGTASTSEILAAGLQEAGRAVVVGDSTLGAVLPSVIEKLPGGAILQYMVADFKTPKGVLLEGRGVQPDRRVIETRAALRSGRDPVLDAGVVAARASKAP
jgi:carboxyl-terminal processing protease